MDKCSHCGNDIPLAKERCPHCALPGLFPNVRAAQHEKEIQALEDRYTRALVAADGRGCKAIVQTFAQAMTTTQAVINRPIGEVQRLANSDNEVYATYYQLSNSGVKIPSDEVWDKRRAATDDLLLTGYKESIRFAALTLDGEGIWHYGACALILKEHMIGHRASVFEENSVMFMQHHGIRVFDADTLPQGFRAGWEERQKLCVAKLAGKLMPGSVAPDFSYILLAQGARPEQDEFVEVHIWGPLTRRTFDRVVIKKGKRRSAATVMLKALREKLREVNVPVEERP